MQAVHHHFLLTMADLGLGKVVMVKDKLNAILSKLGFNRRMMVQFLVLSIGSQTIFCFQAIRSVLYDPFINTLGVNNTQFGILMSLTGLGVLFSAVLGYVQNRIDPRLLITFGLLANGICVLIISGSPSYPVLLVVFGIMGFQSMGIFWPAVMGMVRRVAADDHQGTAFGFLEMIRRATELLQNMLAVAVFTVIGATLGIKVAMVISAIMMIIMAALNFFVLPKEDHAGETSEYRNKKAISDLFLVLKMPQVWLVGVTAAGIYASFVGLQFFLPFLNSVFVLPVLAGAIFGLVNTSVTGMIASPVSGVLADNVFKSPMRYLKLLLALLAIGVFVLLVLPRDQAMLYVTIGLLICLSFLLYLGRGVYYAPIGEMKIPKEISGGAMAVAAFIGYSPMFFAYAIYGYQMDNFSPETAFNRIFMIMLGFACIGFVSSYLLNHKYGKAKVGSRIEA
ncbi:MFS transporter [Porticoccus sp. W117]|uniref:MFS transporter n=1 Tax=Porticoccus sp. W117 TaxID=3054777 RepID=UPI002592D6C0|nr:MFS transporter [Porticoccus sp. W117]MDM3870095.1 MFS transporter [Porticoccus sp. W117]